MEHSDNERVKKSGKIQFLMKVFTRTDDEKMLSMLEKMPANISYETHKNCISDAGKLYRDMVRSLAIPSRWLRRSKDL